jgi:hypothetical protein
MAAWTAEASLLAIAGLAGCTRYLVQQNPGQSLRFGRPYRIDQIVIKGHRHWPWSVTWQALFPAPVRPFGKVIIQFEFAVCEWLDLPFPAGAVAAWVEPQQQLAHHA